MPLTYIVGGNGGSVPTPQASLLIFQPGGSSSDIVVATEAELETAVQATKGRIKVCLDRSLGALNFATDHDWEQRVDVVALPDASHLQPTLTTSAGVSLAGICSMTGLVFSPDSSASIPLIASAATPGWILCDFYGCSLSVNDAFVTMVLPDTSPTEDARINLHSTQVTGSHPVFQPNGRTIYLGLFGGSRLDDGMVTGGTGTLDVKLSDPECRAGVHSGFAGTYKLTGDYCGDYNAAVTYSKGARVLSSSIIYTSLQGTNLAHTPASSAAWWQVG